MNDRSNASREVAAPSSPYRPARLRRRRGDDRLAATVFLLPAGALIASFICYPIGLTFWMSLNDVDQFGRFKRFRGLDKYGELFADAVFRSAAWRTIASM